MKWPILFAVVIALFGVYLLRRNTNNVCKTFLDYYSNRDRNDNCYYNPDHELEVPDIVKRHGYPVETHNVVTEDGYIISVFRIPHGKEAKRKPGKPVFIQHGITLNSGAFVTIKEQSFGFALADAGYDVWLGNFRGSRYALNHTHLDTKDRKFWDFSFHEHGIYDVASQLDLVSQVTKEKIIYIGFSMGGAAGYVYSTTYPEVAHEKIDLFIALSPAVFLRNMPLFGFLAYFWPILRTALDFITYGDIYPRPIIPSILFKYSCLPLPIQMQICQIPDMITLGISYEQNDPETLPVTLQYNSDATSIKAVTHYLQLIQSGNFDHFDYGAEVNKRMYGSSNPPRYDLTKIKFPNYLVYAPNDQLILQKNVEYLHTALPKEATSYGMYAIKNENFNHIDVVAGKDAKKLVYNPIIEFLNRR